MEREKRIIKTRGGHEIEIKTYITFGESREISNVYLEETRVELDENGNPKIGGINASLSSKAQDKAIEVLVISVDGNSENIVKSVNDLPKEDGDELIIALDEIQNPLNTEKKTN